MRRAAETGLKLDVGRKQQDVRGRLAVMARNPGIPVLPLSVACGLAAFFATLADPAGAVELPAPDISALGFGAIELGGVRIDLPDLLLLSVTIGFAMAAALAFRQTIRMKSDDSLSRADARIGELEFALDRSNAILGADDQKCIIWDTADASPEVFGSLPEHIGAPFERRAFLNIGHWLQDDSSRRLEDLVVRLRRAGEGFRIPVRTRTDEMLEVTGRTAGKRAVVRFREITGEQKSLAELKEQAAFVISEMDALRALADQLPFPVWRRDRTGRLAWANGAYAEAVGTSSPESAILAGRELLDPQVRDAVADEHRKTRRFSNIVSINVNESRCRMQVIDLPVGSGSIGIAIDRTEVETIRRELKSVADSNARTLDQLTAAVAAFDATGGLLFSNAAFRELWSLPRKFCEPGASEGAILDHLRAERKLPEQANYREWRDDHLAAYENPEPREEWWHLPDGRTLRMVATPNSEAGLTYILENVTEQLSLESRVIALSRIQGKTLDHLSEGVAVFGSDGRLRLFNPVFANIWRMSPDMLRSEPHVSEIIRNCSALHDDKETWSRIRGAVTGLGGGDPVDGRMERPDGSVIDYATVALPEGMAMIAFVDVTDTVRVQKALSERNEALEAADRLKSDFIQHVSYELRSPLTSIIGFTEMLSDEAIGSLNDQQREYMDHIASSSSALLAIINDILDLATVDAGIMELEIGEVDIARTVRSAVEGLRDRLEEQNIALDLDLPDDIGSFRADENRIRQILFNLAANAIRFSNTGGRIEIAGRKDGGWVEFQVIDRGVGIPEDILPSVFQPFESHSRSGHRKGAGLGLSIVKSLVELHGGYIDVESEAGTGTTVTIRLPQVPTTAAVAAE